MDITNSPVDQVVAINSQIVQYLAVLVAMIGVLVLAYVTLRIGLPRLFGMHTSDTGPIRVLARYPLEPKKTLYLVEAGREAFLLASSDNGITFLTAVAAENVAEMSASKAAEKATRKDFRQMLAWFQGSGESR
jgi:flagellar biogenesis protein FliO